MHLSSTLAAAAAIILTAATTTNAQATVALDYITVLGGSEGSVNFWKGIPFAAPPTGANRWRPPQPPAKVDGVFTATAFGPGCLSGGAPSGMGGGGMARPSTGNSTTGALPALPTNGTTGGMPSGGTTGGMTMGGSTSEDCLTMNVWAPKSATSTSKLPVMVWIYGGGFVGGASSGYNGSTIVGSMGNVLFVSFNYRVGLMGFFSNPAILAEGNGANWGLQDQQFAFAWLKKYISAFGGDPDKMMAFGQSAGSQSVALQMLSYDTSNIPFRAAICESGTHTSFHDTLSVPDQQNFTATIAAAVKCTDSATLLTCLRAANASTMVSASPGDWKPTVDGVVLKDMPLRLVKSGNFARIPAIIGTTTNEGTMFASSVTSASGFDSFLVSNFPWLSAENRTTVASLYSESAFSTPALRAAEVFGDVVFVCPSERFSLERARVTALASGNFRYRFNVSASATLGASHGADIAYVFNTTSSSDSASTTLLRNRMVSWWASFTRTLDPNTEAFAGSPSWPTFGAMPAVSSASEDASAVSNLKQFVINLDSQSTEIPLGRNYMPGHSERCAFWEQIDEEKRAEHLPVKGATVLLTTTASITTATGAPSASTKTSVASSARSASAMLAVAVGAVGVLMAVMI
ncbi:hypothetical protein HDU96_002628 [Phlyctochytrium bullatum]|nr:hypothetical protein HDU96_002628 [Phlyctochytrium bullatum]